MASRVRGGGGGTPAMARGNWAGGPNAPARGPQMLIVAKSRGVLTFQATGIWRLVRGPPPYRHVRRPHFNAHQNGERGIGVCARSLVAAAP